MSCLERVYPMNLMKKMCQFVILPCEDYTQHKPEVVDYNEPFRDFLHQILKVLRKLQLLGPYFKSFADSWPPCCFH